MIVAAININIYIYSILAFNGRITGTSLARLSPLKSFIKEVGRMEECKCSSCKVYATRAERVKAQKKNFVAKFIKSGLINLFWLGVRWLLWRVTGV